MFFPIRSDRRLKHKPWVNYALIAVNVVIFAGNTRSGMLADHIGPYLLHPAQPALWWGLPFQFITYQFLHNDIMHLLGNMLFLYVFGNSVEDRLGKLGYLGFYLAGGVLAGVGHALLSSNPVLGASGSVAAVTGAYLALFPMSNVTIAYWFIIIGTFEISSIYLILFQIAQNVVMHLGGAGGVAYGAHLAGYAYGFVVGMGLLWTRLLPREPYDLLSLIEHRRRRARFTALTRQGYQPWESRLPSDPSAAGAGAAAAPPRSAHEQRIADLRQRVAQAVSNHDLPAAAADYLRLLELDPQQVMSQQQQLDLANQLAAMARYNWAARAYELFLERYRAYPQREQVELMLALIYGRYLHQSPRAVELLDRALPRLTDADQKELAQHMRAELKG